jgi:hypothetical protein
MRKLTILAVALAVAAIGFAADAQATCNPNKTAATFNAIEGRFYYFEAPADANVASLVGHWWQLGAYAAANDTPSTTDRWAYFFEGNPAFGSINNQMGSYANTGCPAGNLITTLHVTTASGGAAFIAMTIDETPATDPGFDYSRLGTVSMAAIPRLGVASSSRNATNVDLNVNVPPTNAGAVGPSASTAIAGYDIVSFAGTADPGRAASNWGSPTTLSAPGGTAASGLVSVDCSNTAVDRFVAVRINYADGQKSDLVGPSVRVECDPTMADPDRDFKLIDGPKQKPRPARER